MSSSGHITSGDSGPDEQQDNTATQIQRYSVAPEKFQQSAGAPNAEHPVPQLGYTMAPIAYSYMDPYYGGIIAGCGGQHVTHPPMMGMHHAGVPLPTDMVEEPVYVNAKQYHGILRRRQSRAKAESKNNSTKSRKPYLHESRHLHALKRARGCGGRFLNTKAEGSQESHTHPQDNAQTCNGLYQQNSGSENQQNNAGSVNAGSQQNLFSGNQPDKPSLDTKS